MLDLDWTHLPFGYVKTDYHVRSYYKNGQWSSLEFSNDDYIPIHIAATAIHYGQQAFEGLKAYRGKDGKIRLFRWIENARRLQHSARGLYMPEVPEQLFYEAIVKAVKLNIGFVPPYGTGASLYIRPLLIGTGAEVGVKPASEYMFLVFVTPVGPYFKEGFNPVKIGIVRDSDRAAPLGTGTFKVGGNYAASLRGIIKVQKNGYNAPMYLDAKEKKYIDEIGAANFFGIKQNIYVTPQSTSILASITNKSLMHLARDMGLAVEQRPLPIDELETFEEVGACGTAAIISPIGLIVDLETGKEYHFCKDGKAGPVSTELYKTILGIQFGDIPDPYNWIEYI